MVIQGVVFDIDDTLYLERDYVTSGFAHVARLVGGDAVDRDAVRRWLVDAFEAGTRGEAFNRLLDTFPEIGARHSVDALVAAYRGHRPAIELDDEVESTLETLRAEGLHLGALSDGPLASQKAKADALGLRRWLDPIVFTDALGPGNGKPATTAFQAVGRAWAIPPSSLVYVGDNPAKDFAGPRMLGWLAVRLRQPGQLHYRLEPASDELEPDFEIAALPDVVALIRELRRT